MKFRSLFYAVLCLHLFLPTANCQMNAEDSALSLILLSEPSTSCRELANGACSRIERYFLDGDTDSIRLVIDFMKKHCNNHTFDALDTLLMIRSGFAMEDICDSITLRSIIFRRYSRRFWDYEHFTGFDVVIDGSCQRLKSLSRELADSLLKVVSDNSTIQLYLMDYLNRNDEILLKLKHGTYRGLCVQEQYDSAVAIALRSVNGPRGHLGANLGIWTPLRSSNVLHQKLEFGGQFGYRQGRLGFDVTSQLRVLNEPDDYEVLHNGVIQKTSHFVGGLIGTEVTFVAIRLGRMRLELFAGVGYDGFQATNEKEGFKALSEFNKNLGFSLRFFYNKWSNQFIGIQVRHNFVSYSAGGGSNLSGNTLSLNVIFGIMNSLSGANELEYLKYYDDQ